MCYNEKLRKKSMQKNKIVFDQKMNEYQQEAVYPNNTYDIKKKNNFF